ncbi:diguanylate cyclase/phosphodiesterase with PAS/PAC and GAF sensor(s) [Shewanella sediminis HAW-EB3]|uniref:Diguanylate cyclase/phosphodiesterase with PAS/PAC and GAF sensor(S) n=1 Tax=Shewanella sediminis (strain HAW-EB3) TaxID=425104 RepID=A8FPU7_SHESH|nr:EAL domain-containing protein [Shewanella sediminis]ABV34870.1 diguanylate cyclase/phosphodiesterase with PAS/PAC and GAF sensor(s) [Shewanella sediminis HAW-EB3]
MDRWSYLLSKLSSDRPSLSQRLQAWQLEPNALPLAIIQGYHFIGANPLTLSYFQTQTDNFVNATPYDFSPRIQSSGRNSIEYAQQMMRHALEGDVIEFNWLHLSQQGRELPTRVSLFPFEFEGSPVILAMFEPSNRRSRSRESANNGFDMLPKELLSITLEDSAEAAYITDAEHRIIAVNKAMCRISGYSADQLLHKNAEVIDLKRHTAAEEMEHNNALEERGNWQGEVWKQRSDGTEFPAWKSCRKILAEERVYYVTIFSDISTKKKLEAKLTEQAMFDTLTGLPNRHHLKLLLNQALQEIKETPGKMGALMFLDLNGFKNINDCFGHATGDKVLQLVSARLEASCIEKADIARLGGDEFTLVLRDCNGHQEVEDISQQIMSLFEAPFEIDDQKLYLGTSIGIALFPEHSSEANKLLSLADTAMYSAKQSPEHVLFYNNSMHEEAEQKLTILSELRHAHNLKQFSLAYQVIVNLECNSVIGAEALLRWQKPDGEILNATDFVPLLEEAGLLITIGQWVLKQACLQVATWRTQHAPDLKACVNVSPMQLEHPDFVQQVTEALTYSQLPANALVLEITELALLRQPQRVKKTLTLLKSKGISIAIDDFGAGLSSLSKLGSLPIDSLKIDAGFAHRLSEPQGKELCQAMIKLAQALDISFVVEGIETKQQKEILKNMGKGFGQGYFFGHPKEAARFTPENFSTYN